MQNFVVITLLEFGWYETEIFIEYKLWWEIWHWNLYLRQGLVYIYIYLRTAVILTHWGRVTHICVGNLTIIGSDNGLSPGRRQAIIWTNAGILLIRTLGTNFSEILIQINAFSNKKMHIKMSSGKCRPLCLGLNELSWWPEKITWIKKEKWLPAFIFGCHLINLYVLCTYPYLVYQIKPCLL